MNEASPWATAAVNHVGSLAGGPALDRTLRVTLNFHPDRYLDGLTVIELLQRDGIYRSQFETGTSNGGLTAHPGGQRWLWEDRLFGGAYTDAHARERPKYGALNHRRRSVGGAIRFGSSHLRLKEHMLDRTTFCFPDSVFEPTHFGTAGSFALTSLADKFDAVERDDRMEAETGGVLDDYIEAHVHGIVNIGLDVEAIVLDPSYRDRPVHEAAAQLGVPLEWHEGRELDTDTLDLHPDFRGPGPVELGHRLARSGRLDAQILGEAAASQLHDPQDLKLVWHLVARFGSHVSPSAGR